LPLWELGTVLNTRANIRNATQEDISALACLRYGQTMHRDRLKSADGKKLRYLVVQDSYGDIVGFGLLVLAQPDDWPQVLRIPQAIDLYIDPEMRGRGYGTALLQYMEQAARAAGMEDFFLGVDPDNNVKAYELYKKMRYEDIDPEPIRDTWEYIDSDGTRHSGVDWIIHMRKEL
jgi:GNAT superfamily N-acetyltransferase